jgi:hypothetical protein
MLRRLLACLSWRSGQGGTLPALACTLRQHKWAAGTLACLRLGRKHPGLAGRAGKWPSRQASSL